MDLLKQQRPRKLNLNAPLLSTKRYGFSSPSDNNSLCAGAGVPFSWEQAPGKPKHNDKNDYAQGGDTPRPRLPPPAADVSDDDDDDDEDYDEVYSDAMDVFSLSEALDIVQKKSEKARCNKNSNTNEGLLRLKIQESDGYQSPTYMINRFLPDATALAASSALHFPSNCDEKGCETCSYQECCLSSARSSAVRNDNYNDNAYSYSYSYSPKACYCGLEVLLPWRVKHKLCSMKSPVLLPPLKKKKAEEHNQRGGAKQKKHRRRSSSSTLTHLPCSCTNSKEDSI